MGFQGFLQTQILIQICPLTPTNHRGIIHSIQRGPNSFWWNPYLDTYLDTRIGRYSFLDLSFKPVPWLLRGGGGPTPQLRSAAVSRACRSPPPRKKFGRNVSASFARIVPPETKKWHFLWPKVGPQETNWSIGAPAAWLGQGLVQLVGSGLWMIKMPEYFANWRIGPGMAELEPLPAFEGENELWKVYSLHVSPKHPHWKWITLKLSPEPTGLIGNFRLVFHLVFWHFCVLLCTFWTRNYLIKT